jgi:hypothetical protein
MNKGWLLFWSAFFIGFGVSDILDKAYGWATFDLIFGIGIAVNLLERYRKEASDDDKR